MALHAMPQQGALKIVQMKILISPNFIWKSHRENDPLVGKDVAIMFCKV